MLMKKNAVLEWFNSVQKQTGPKFITGLRGTGKTAGLRLIEAQLKKAGIPAERRLWIDTDDPLIRRYPTAESMHEYIVSHLPRTGKCYLLVREAAALPDAAVLLGVLIADSRLEIYATSSSKRLLERGLSKYLGDNLVHLELLPSVECANYVRADARALWNEIFISDILEPNIVLETGLLYRAVGWLSDHIGDPLSLRIISRAISPTQRELSPHTIERSLKTLEDSHLIEKAQVADVDTGVVSKRNYKYFFTDPALRTAQFGPAPDDESRRAALNRAWLTLRHDFQVIRCTLRDPEVDFLTESDQRIRRWRANETGKPIEVKN